MSRRDRQWWMDRLLKQVEIEKANMPKTPKTKGGSALNTRSSKRRK